MKNLGLLTITWYGESGETHSVPTMAGARDFIFETARFHRAEGSSVNVFRVPGGSYLSIAIWENDTNRCLLRMSARRF